MVVRLLRGFIGLILLGVALWGATVFGVYAYGRLDRARPADAIVVLGAAQYDGRPSPVLRARLDHAIDLYNQGIAPLLITTGGVGAGDTVSEAMVGRRYAVRAGVPASAVLVEQTGLRSVRSLEAVAEMMRERELSSAVLVSDPFHMLRLRILALRLRIKAYTSPTRTSPITRDSGEEWRLTIRESVSILLMLLPGDP